MRTNGQTLSGDFGWLGLGIIEGWLRGVSFGCSRRRWRMVKWRGRVLRICEGRRRVTGIELELAIVEGKREWQVVEE